jgi:Ca-activated chloride channel family protein
MSFASPLMLLSLAAVPALVAGYLWLTKRRAAGASKMGAVSAVPGSARQRPGWRRHLPPTVFLAAIALLLFALARPEVSGFPHREGTVILALDVSGSMKATDFKPSRLEAAKQAAETFVSHQPSTVNVGVVAFGNGGLVVQQPTNVKKDVTAAIERLSVGGSTSLSEGIMTALGVIAGKPITLDQAAQEGDLESVNIGYFGSAVVVLLSDGENLSGLDPLNAAQIAGNAGVRVFTIGVGSPEGATVEIDGYRVATALNEALLKEVANRTSATYFAAEDTASLGKVYDHLDLHLATVGEPTEVTGPAAAAAMLLLVVGGALSMRWFGRVP